MAQFPSFGAPIGDDGFAPHGAFDGFQGHLSQGAYLRPSLAPSPLAGPGSFADDEYANEPPLLEELGVNFGAIGAKTAAVLMLHRPITPEVLLDADLAGPIVFCVVLGFCLLLVRALRRRVGSGKLHFGYIYGFGLLGCCGMYMLVNLMQGLEEGAQAQEGGGSPVEAAPPAPPLGLVLTVSMLGYCLLPIVLLAALAVFTSLHGLHGMVLGLAAILWSTLSCARFFEVALRMADRKWLIAYPAGLFYACFALMAIF